MALRKYIEECDYVAYALKIASEVKGLNKKSTYKEAMSSSESSKWLIAMMQEMKSLVENEAWNITEAAKKKKIVGCKWIFKKEDHSNGVAPFIKLV